MALIQASTANEPVAEATRLLATNLAEPSSNNAYPAAPALSGVDPAAVAAAEGSVADAVAAATAAAATVAFCGKRMVTKASYAPSVG